jgi:hypothetical protein
LRNANGLKEQKRGSKMLTQVAGFIRDGRVELSEDISVAEGTQVMVTFLREEQPVRVTMDPQKALDGLARIRRNKPPVDVVEMILEAREDLAARTEI